MKEVVFQKDSTYSLRGICMLLIVLHHVYQYTASRYGVSYPLPLAVIFQSFGYLATGVFFLLSGYGLTFSMNKQESITLQYVLSQMLKLYKPFLLIWFVSSLVDLLFFNENDLISLMANATTLNLIGGGSFWFLKEIFIVYLCTLLIFSFIRDNKYRVAVILMSITTFVIVGKWMGMGDHWLNSIVCFPIGMCCFYSLEQIVKINTVFSGSILVLLFVMAFLGRFIVGTTALSNEATLSVVKLMMQIVSVGALSLYAIRLVSMINVKNSILSYLGTNSLCVYLYHLYFLSVFSFIDDVWLYVLVSLVCTIMLTLIYGQLKDRVLIVDNYTKIFK